MVANILDHQGNPIPTQAQQRANDRVREVVALRRQINQMIKGRYDAAADGNEAFRNHWANTDHLSPDSANSYRVRRKLRSRSRFEVVENNPYLKGIVLTIVNDFTGGGVKLKITDPRLGRERKRLIKRRFRQWAKAVKLRKKLWRLRMAKLVDGETFAVAITNNRLRTPIKLDFNIIECDRVTDYAQNMKGDLDDVIDGIRIDKNGFPTEYFILDGHPGTTIMASLLGNFTGQWVPAEQVIHWFRQDRGWHRGIPETTPSLPLCALLRRYTLAVVKAAETSADFAAVLQTDGPPGTAPWTDESGNVIDDDPFDTFPIEQGMFVTLPWGYKLEQMKSEHPTTVYDSFVDALLREIARPLLAPFNYAAGTSKDSNMASAVVDGHIYKGSQNNERCDSEEEVMARIFEMWWEEAIRIPGYLDEPISGEQGLFVENPTLRNEFPEYGWGWDRVGIDHTDPLKVAKALETLKNNNFITDRDIQEGYYNRDLEDWQEEVLEEKEFRDSITPAPPESDPDKTEVDEEESEEAEDDDE